jgi:hypothetical protein
VQVVVDSSSTTVANLTISGVTTMNANVTVNGCWISAERCDGRAWDGRVALSVVCGIETLVQLIPEILGPMVGEQGFHLLPKRDSVSLRLISA